jgi:hypothetical protein
VRLAVALLLCGCGRVAFDATVAPDALPPSDGGCTWTPFSPPSLVPGPVQSMADDWFPTPARGELELYFYRYIGATGDAEIVRATRPDTADTFGASSLVMELESADDDTSVGVTEDALVIVLTRTAMTTHLYEATRASPADMFSTPVEIASIRTADDDLSPWLTADGLRMVFASRRTSALLDLFETTRPSRTAAWAQPTLLAPVSSPGRDDNPTLREDGLELFFSSDRAGSQAYDVYRATRPATDQPFEAPVRVPELSSARDDIGTRLSRDGRRMYLAYDSVRSGGQNAGIYVATRDCQ